MKKKTCECGGRMRRLYARGSKEGKAFWFKTEWWYCMVCHNVKRFIKEGVYE